MPQFVSGAGEVHAHHDGILAPTSAIPAGCRSTTHYRRMLSATVRENTCDYSQDGECDDGGAGSEYSACGELGTDCEDCGPVAQTAPARASPTSTATP